MTPSQFHWMLTLQILTLVLAGSLIVGAQTLAEVSVTHSQFDKYETFLSKIDQGQIHPAPKDVLKLFKGSLEALNARQQMDTSIRDFLVMLAGIVMALSLAQGAITVMLYRKGFKRGKEEGETSRE